MEHPGAYARKVLVNLALDARRERSRRQLELEEPGAPSTNGVGESSASVDLRADLLRALADLSARQRAILVLRYFADLPETQVAEIVGCSTGTVKSSSSRALQRLRTALGEPVPEQRAEARGNDMTRTLP